MTEPQFPAIIAKVSDTDDGARIQAAVYHALSQGYKPSAAKKFAAASAPHVSDRDSILTIGSEYVSIRRVAVHGEERVFDLAGAEAGLSMAVIAWRTLVAPGGVQDRRQGSGPPAVNASHWMVSVDEVHTAEPLDEFLQRSAKSGWHVTATTLLGTVEQNSGTEAWLTGLNIRDTRFERVLTQMLFLHRDGVPETPGSTPLGRKPVHLEATHD